MKLTIRNGNLVTEHAFDALIESRLIALADRVRIDDALVTIERLSDASPPYRVQLHIAVPGPDLRAEHNDNTARQAFTRALDDIERKLRGRELKRIGRIRARAPRTCVTRLRSGGCR
jgi:ribosome-associated translation inhibitor RaiA